MKKLFLTALFTICMLGLYAQGSYQQLMNRYVGERKITLQWLDTSPTQKCKPGKVTISQEPGEMSLRIVGKQSKNANEYVVIEGTIEPVSIKYLDISS